MSENHDEHDDNCGKSVIRPIEQESVQRIIAGQAVTDLASAVKELVDNSLDAHSSSINVRLFNQGVDIVEVTDDGDGVPPSSRPYMAAPHATSKIRRFEDINRDTNPLATLGFRGEALFCLANLCQKLIVATRTAEETMAQRMEFKRDGTIDPSTVSEMHRKIGTTVAAVKLLDALPVRRTDMIRSIQRQRHKLVRMIEGYAIFSVGVRICLMDMVPSAGSYREQPILTTALNNRSVEANISSVMGSRFLSDLSRVTVDLSSCHTFPVAETDDGSYGKNHSDGQEEEEKAEIQGFISSAKPQGSLRPQRKALRNAQFFSINGRPVELPQVSRVLSDAWRAFGPSSDGKKKPSCVLCFKLPNSAYDINLSPEKRQVMLTKEKEICQLIHETVANLWASETEGKFTQNELATSSQSAPEQTGNIANMFASLGAVKKRSCESTEGEEISRMSPESRKRHKRRHAFVHDFNKAKMQHEHDSRRQKQEDTNATKGLTATKLMSSKDDNDKDDEDDNDEDRGNGEKAVDVVLKVETEPDEEADPGADTLTCTGKDLGKGTGTGTGAFGEAGARTMETMREHESPNDIDGKNKVEINESAAIDANDCSGASKATKSFPSSSLQKITTSSPTSLYPCKTDGVLKNEEGDEKRNEPLVVAPMAMGRGEPNEKNHLLGTKSFITTLRKVSNDKFTSSQHNEDGDDESPKILEPKTVSPLNPEIVDYPDKSSQQRGHDNIHIRHADIPSSDADRRRWIQLQTKFNCQENISDADDIQSLISRCSKSASNQISPSDDRDMLTSSAQVTNNNEEEASSDCENSGENKKDKFDLGRFSFRRVSNDNNIASDVSGKSPQSTKQSNEARRGSYVVLPDSKQISLKHSNNANSVVNVNRRVPMSPRGKRSLSHKIQNEETNQSQHSEDDHRVVLTSQSKKVVARSSTPPPDDDDDDSPRKHKQSQEDEFEETPEPKVVHWGAFKGTKDIVLSSRLERVKTREYRRKLKTVRSSNKDSAANGPVLDDVGEGGTTITLSKGKFSEMSVIGQFNLGFILAKCPKNHLWILDQHACDEKYNFERLVANTIIHEQKLIAPMPLELSPSEETCILDHMDIFEKNGFRFKYDPDKEPRHRFALTALPHSGACDGKRAVQFGREDVSALCDILCPDADGDEYADYSSGALGGGTGTDGGGMYGNNAVRRYAGSGIVSRYSAGRSRDINNDGEGETADKIITRLPKAIAMFASRACRSSIMIGKPLSSKEMEKVIKHIDEVEDPWTCAHGRPAMSHVGDLQPLLLQENNDDAEHVAGPTVTIMTQQMTEEE